MLYHHISRCYLVADSKRIGQLDGVRALAIILVFTVHANFFGYGWTGVPLFFVLSGFLITGILRKSRTNTWFWRPFYIKRATRILPPLVLAVCGAAAVYDIPWRKIAVYEIFFLANVVELLYPRASQTLGVLWSLAVEEHFYLLWPFAIRFVCRKHLIAMLTCILIAEPLLRALATPSFHTFWPIFLLTPFQLDGLVAGSLLGLLIEDNHTAESIRQIAGPLAVFGLLLFVSMSFIPIFHREVNSMLFNSVGYSLITIVAVSFIAYIILMPDSLPSRLLANRTLVFIGTISYGLYLFHPLALLFASYAATELGVVHHRLFAPVAILVAVSFSWFSFRFYERPIILWGRNKASKLSQQTI